MLPDLSAQILTNPLWYTSLRMEYLVQLEKVDNPNYLFNKDILMTTAVVPITSDVKRKKWMREGLLQAASKSFWSSLTGTTKDAVVFQAKNEGASGGHTVVFDFDGNLSGKAVKGKATAFGKGEQKKLFSDKITVDRYRLVVDNGDAFDAVDVDNLALSQHGDSRTKLGDLFVRWKDQSLFDAAQGLLITNDEGRQAATHVIDLGATFNFNTLLDISRTLKTSQGYTTGGIRRPITPYMMSNGEPVWLFVMDSFMATKLKQDTAGYQTIVRSGDVRGEGNRNIKGVIGKLGNLLIVEADTFFGDTGGTTGGFGLNDSEIEIAGLRQYDGANPTTAVWSGQAGFDYASTDLHSRGLILGGGALQLAFGKQPDYKYKASQDFDIKSESAVEFWCEARKTKLKTETGADYKQAKVAGIDHGVIAVDLKVN